MSWLVTFWPESESKGKESKHATKLQGSRSFSVSTEASPPIDSTSFPNSTTIWDPSFQTQEPLRDSSHPNHLSSYSL